MNNMYVHIKVTPIADQTCSILTCREEKLQQPQRVQQVPGGVGSQHPTQWRHATAGGNLVARSSALKKIHVN